MDEAALLIPAKRKLWFKVESAVGVKKPRRKGNGPAKEYELDFLETQQIGPALAVGADIAAAQELKCNIDPHLVYQGVTPGHDGFVLDRPQFETLLDSDNASSLVIHPYVTGRDLLIGDGHSDRYIIDFQERDLFSAQHFMGAFRHVENHVLKDVSRKAKDEHSSETARKSYMEHWWQLWRPRADFIAGLTKLAGRYVACSRVTKRPIFVFLNCESRPSDKVQAFLFDDDYSFSILQAEAHWRWFVAKCSKLKSDFSYSTTSVWQTFAWPQAPAAKLVTVAAEAGREVRRVREEALAKVKGGLRAVYRTLELPGKNPLKEAHAALDAAVLAA